MGRMCQLSQVLRVTSFQLMHLLKTAAVQPHACRHEECYWESLMATQAVHVHRLAHWTHLYFLLTHATTAFTSTVTNIIILTCTKSLWTQSYLFVFPPGSEWEVVLLHCRITAAPWHPVWAGGSSGCRSGPQSHPAMAQTSKWLLQ